MTARVWVAVVLGMTALVFCLLPWVAGDYARGWAEALALEVAPIRPGWGRLTEAGQALAGLSQSVTVNWWVCGAALVVVASYLYVISVGSVLCRFLAQRSRVSVRLER